MPNGKYVIQDLQFERELEQMDSDQKLNFIARLSYSNAIRITSLENRNKKAMAASGGAGGVIGVAVAAALDFFLRRGS